MPKPSSHRAYSINGTGNTLDNLLRGNDAANTLNGSLGNDLLEGGIGNDVSTDNAGAAPSTAVPATTALLAARRRNVYLGGWGTTSLTTGAGNDVVLFNKGDGQDSFATGGSGSDTVSRRRHRLQRPDLFQVRQRPRSQAWRHRSNHLQGLVCPPRPSRPVANLGDHRRSHGQLRSGEQPVARSEGRALPTLAGLRAAFDTARAADATLTNWGCPTGDPGRRRSDTAAWEEILPTSTARAAPLAGIGVTPALAVIADVNLGTVAVTLNPLAALQTGSVRLT